MGGICSCEPKVKKAKHGGPTKGHSEKLKSLKSFDSPKKHSCPSSKLKPDNYDETESKNKSTSTSLDISSELKPPVLVKTGSRKIAKQRSFLERAGITSLQRAAGVLATLGNGMSNLNPGKRFISGMTSKGYKISILAFEVANTIAKVATLLLSLSEENLKFLKREILYSKGVRTLVSSDMKELLSIAASDKREELNVLSKEVIRFGNLCKDPHWHDLDKYFSKLESDHSHHKHVGDEAEIRMQELVTLAQLTSELYHEMRALDIFEQDYKRKLNEMKALNLPQKGESLTILHNELRQQRKFVKSLKKKSLWSRNLEEIMEKLVDAVAYIYQAIAEAFGMNGLGGTVQNHGGNRERLGDAGLTLHYANLIQQLYSIASRPSSLPPNIRDTLYNALPESVKKALRSRLRARVDELSESKIKAELEKTLCWLLPLAINTTRAYQGFGWVGEWANTRIDLGKGKAIRNKVTQLQTLHHADREKMDSCILEMIILLNRLISSVSRRDNSMKRLPPRPPINTGFNISISKTDLPPSPSFNTTKNKTCNTELSPDERLLLEKAIKRRSIPAISRSLESVVLKKKRTKVWALSKSMGSSPNQDTPEFQNTNDLNLVQ